MNTQQTYECFLDDMVDRKLVIFGTSVAASKSLAFLINEDVYFYCDNNKGKWGTFFQGREVCSPERLLSEKDNVVVVIASEAEMEIRRQLVGMGVSDHVYSYLILSMKARHNPYGGNVKLVVPDECIAGYQSGMPYKNSIPTIRANQGKIDEVKALLADEKSKDVYEKIIHNRKYNYVDYEDLMEPMFNQYFADDIFSFSEKEIYVDAGTNTGSVTAAFMARVNAQYEKVYAFEPDPAYHDFFVKRYGKEMSEGKIKLIAKGLHDKQQELRFEHRENNTSTVSESGDIVVEVTRLDSEIEGRVTFMTMDIEGSEIPALLGARETISRCKPKLGICLYHRLEHLWEIPLLIHEMVPEYQLFVRHHACGSSETVLYATL